MEIIPKHMTTYVVHLLYLVKHALIKSMECNFKSVSYDKYHDLIVH